MEQLVTKSINDIRIGDIRLIRELPGHSTPFT